MNKLKIPTIDDLKEMDFETRREYLETRYEWLKKVRKEDKEIYRKEYIKIANFLYRCKKRMVKS